MQRAASVLDTLADFLERTRRAEQCRRRWLHKALFPGVVMLLMVSWEPADAACTSSVCATSPTDLGTLGGSNGINSQAFAVSDNGSIVVGSSLVFDRQFSVYAPHAFLWQNGAMIDLGTLGGTGPYFNAYAFDVSGNGKVVVGAATTASGEGHAFRWTASTGMEDLGTLGVGSAALAVNSNGSVIVGGSGQHAFRWTSSGGMSDLGTLGGDNSIAYDVNDKGDVVVGGSSISGPAGTHAFRWTASTGMVDLRPLGGDLQANAVDGSGATVVGWAEFNSMRKAFVCTAGTGMLDLAFWLHRLHREWH